MQIFKNRIQNIVYNNRIGFGGRSMNRIITIAIWIVLFGKNYA